MFLWGLIRRKTHPQCMARFVPIGFASVAHHTPPHLVCVHDRGRCCIQRSFSCCVVVLVLGCNPRSVWYHSGYYYFVSAVCGISHTHPSVVGGDVPTEARQNRKHQSLHWCVCIKGWWCNCATPVCHCLYRAESHSLTARSPLSLWGKFAITVEWCPMIGWWAVQVDPLTRKTRWLWLANGHANGPWQHDRIECLRDWNRSTQAISRLIYSYI